MERMRLRMMRLRNPRASEEAEEEEAEAEEEEEAEEEAAAACAHDAPRSSSPIFNLQSKSSSWLVRDDHFDASRQSHT